MLQCKFFTYFLLVINRIIQWKTRKSYTVLRAIAYKLGTVFDFLEVLDTYVLSKFCLRLPVQK